MVAMTSAMTPTITEADTATDGRTDWPRLLSTPIRAQAWRAYGYVVAVTLLAAVVMAYLFAVVLATGLLMVTLIGVPLLALVVLSGRAWSRLYRSLARLAGTTIETPPPFGRPTGWWLTLRAALTDAVGWRALGFLALQALVMLVVGYWVLVGVAMAGALVISPVAWLVMDEPFVTLGEPIDSLGAYLALAVGGLVALYLLGWVMIGIARVHTRLATALLGPSGQSRRVTQLERTRAAAVEDSAATLRRVERELHDGTQARLITVAMALVRAEEHLTDDTETAGARALVSNALANTKDALAELREVVRGIRPPALDLGLDAAVQTLAARNPIPVEVSTDIAARPSLGIETLAYFCIAELLANVSRHSGAAQASVTIRSDAESLRIVVVDNGTGGAELGGGSGLTGLRDRVETVDGQLTVDSPAGGPTTVTVVMPTGQAE